MCARRFGSPTAHTSSTTVRSSAAAHQISWPRTRTCGGFIWGPTSVWTKIELARLMPCHLNERRYDGNGDTAEAANTTGAEADPDAIVAAGHQTSADVDVGARRSPESRSRREPTPRRSPDRRSAGG